MSGSDKDDKTGVFKDLKTRVAQKSIQVQMASGKIYGPYSRNEILSFIEEKRIRGEEKILFEGETGWKPIASDTEFYDAIHAILSGKKVKRPEIRNEVSGSIDSSDKTRASGKPSSTQTEVIPQGNPADRTRFTEFTGGSEGPPIWNPPLDIPLAAPPLNDVVAPPPNPAPTAAKKTSSGRPKNKSRIGLVLIVAAVFGVAVVMNKKQDGASSGDPEARSFVPSAARFYTWPLSSLLGSLRLPADVAVPNDVKKTNVSENFSYSLNAHKIVARLNAGFENRDQPEAKTSGYWAQRAIDLQLLGLCVQVANVPVGTNLLKQGKALWKVLQDRKLVDDGEEKLLGLVTSHALGDWDAAVKNSTLVASPIADWIHADAIWWNSWLQGVKRNLPASVDDRGLSAELELVDKIRLAYSTDDPQMATWLLQTASVEPDSPYLWYASAQINWRKSRNVQVQNAYRDFIIGLGSLSLYPPAIQIAYWTQFADFLRSYARAETYHRALDNIALLRSGDVSREHKAQKLWWDIGDDGLTAKDIADEILARSASGMLNARDQAALEVLGSSLEKGSQYLFVVGTHLAFEGEWTNALNVFDGILSRDPKNTDALFGKIWALGRLFRFSEAQDTYATLVKSSLGSITHLRSKALIHFMGREYLEAHRVLNDYLKQAPTDAWAHYFEAGVFLAQENYLECIKSANLAKLTAKGELQFRSEQTFFRCRVKGGVGIRDSLQSIAKEIKESPDNLPLRIIYIELMQESHLYDDAIRVLDDSLKYFPFSTKLKLAAGSLYDSQGMPVKSLEYYTQAEKLDPTLAEPWVRIGQVLLKQDKYLEAAKNFEIAARVQPTYPEIYLFAARAYENAGMVDEAASSYAKEIQERPSAVGTFVEAAEFLLKNNAPQKIPELYRRFQTGGYQEDPRALVRLAQAYNIMNDLENAKAYASRAVAGNPDNPYANLILANILDRAADYNLAKRYYESYLRLMPLAEDRESLRDRLSKPPYAN